MRKPPLLPPSRILLTYVQLNGPRASKVIRMALDTGATHTMVSIEKLIAIGYDPATVRERLEIATANGVIVAPVVPVRGIESLGTRVQGLNVIAHNLPEPTPVQGLLGLDFLVHIPAFRKFLSLIRLHLI